MSYQVIARKWRPQTFEDVIGQDAITQTLRNALEHDRLHHAYLFSGARGVGKTTTARLLAKALNCRKSDSPNARPCDTGEDDACVSCKEIAESRSLDVLEFDAASHTKVEEIRDIILESIIVNPARDRFKVFIIDEVHMLSTSSFNALLKTLEEPPQNVVFVMATTELHKVPDTILSRCQQFDFRTIPLQKILGRLKEIADAEKIEISDDALREIARSGEGSMRDAQSNFDQVISFSGESINTEDVIAALGIASAENLTKTIEAIANKDSAKILNVVEDLVERGQDLRNFSRDLLTFIRDLLIVKIAGDSQGLLESAILRPEDLKQHSAPFLETDLVRFFNSIAETESKMRDATEPRYLLEIGLIKLLEMRNLIPIEDLLERLSKLEIALSEENSDTDEKVKPLAAVPEKKTLSHEIRPENVPFPVKNSPKHKEKSSEKESIPDPGVSGGRDQIREAPAKAPEDAPPKNPSPEENPTIRNSIKDRIKIDIESMPVRLDPISAEELEHVEDKKLDNEFEDHLRREGDTLRVFPQPDKLISILLQRESETVADPYSAIGNNSAAAIGVARATDNKALDIVSEMAAYEEIDETLPVLPENPTDEQLLEYAENHPAVKKVKRIFRGTIVNVSREDK